MVKCKVIAVPSYKKEQRFKETLSFFIYSLAMPFIPYTLFGPYPIANFGPLLRGQCHSPNVNTAFIPVLTQRLLEASKRDWVHKPGRALCGFWIRNLPIHLQHLNSLVHSPHVRVIKMIWFVVASFWDFLAYALHF